MFKRILATVMFCIGALVLILTAALYGWPEVIDAYFSHSGSYSFPILLGFGFLAGAFSFFAPCAFVLMPGYVSYCLAHTENRLFSRHRLFYSIFTGSLCGLGAVIFFLFLGIGASLVGSSFSQYLIKIKPLAALFFLILGTLLAANISLDLSPVKNRIPMRFSTNRNAGGVPMGGFFLYGFGYGLATTGCTFPIFFSLIVVPVTSGRFFIGFLPFVSFALAMGLMMVVITVLVGLSKDAFIKRLTSSAEWIKRSSGVILILAGLYLGYFFIKAGM